MIEDLDGLTPENLLGALYGALASGLLAGLVAGVVAVWIVSLLYGGEA